MKNEIDKAVEVLKSGGIIIYPTDTLWGLGCDATNQEAVQRIYDLKKSDNKHSMLVLVRDVASVARYTTNVPQVAWDLMEVSDAPLTTILPGAVGVAQNLIPQECTLGVRVPQHQFCEELLKKLNRPIVSSSVNISGEKPAVKFEDIPQEIINSVDMVIDKRFEGKPTFAPSSIISIGQSGEIKIIR